LPAERPDRAEFRKIYFNHPSRTKITSGVEELENGITGKENHRKGIAAAAAVVVAAAAKHRPILLMMLLVPL
jgi:hypothetical protein